MSSESKPLTVPPFESKLPPEFVEGLDNRGKYLYASIDRITHAQEWLMERAVIDAKTLDEVKAQTLKTNGRTTANEEAIKRILSEMEETRPAINAAKVGLKVLKNKWFWVGGLAFFTFGIPFLASNSEKVKKVLAFLIGA